MRVCQVCECPNWGNAVVNKGLGTRTSAARSAAVAVTMSMRLAGTSVSENA
jgi:hypothetical protein